MKRRWMLVVVFGILVPVLTLVYGWAYASIRENRIKDRVITEMEARGDPAAAYERSYATWHRRIEWAGLGGLTILLSAAAWFTYAAIVRERELAAKKNAFVAAVTHELRTPLTTLRMHAEMLDENLVPEERRARVYGEMVREADRLSRLIENVLAMSRLEDGRWLLEKKRGDISQSVEQIISSLRPRADAAGFTLRVDSAPCPEIEFDPRAVELVTQNLVDNALKYASASEPKEVDVRLRPTNAGVELRVSDHGPGIDPARHDVIFERFARAGTQEKPGTGLGLALVRELARAHGGDAHVVATERGTTISVVLPA